MTDTDDTRNRGRRETDDAPFCGSPDTPTGIPCQRTVADGGTRCAAHQPTPGAALGGAMQQVADVMTALPRAFADAVDTLNRWHEHQHRQRRIRERYVEFDAEELPPALPSGVSDHE